MRTEPPTTAAKAQLLSATSEWSGRVFPALLNELAPNAALLPGVFGAAVPGLCSPASAHADGSRLNTINGGL